uniref:Uncharacterized protein n=1 Tax=Glossina brevipalpis TaxID=37001 RepID=A0A1A9WBL3_9MUSC
MITLALQVGVYIHILVDMEFESFRFDLEKSSITEKQTNCVYFNQRESTEFMSVQNSLRHVHRFNICFAVYLFVFTFQLLVIITANNNNNNDDDCDDDVDVEM